MKAKAENKKSPKKQLLSALTSHFSKLPAKEVKVEIEKLGRRLQKSVEYACA